MVYIEKNNEGIKYFIYLISNNKIIPYIDTDIRKIIWNFLTTSYIILNVNNIQLKLNIYI
uniref:Uncharacterized protein n=1 Tax=viral metagenome TaxID=1070528 RepID=A0A6C0AYP5_9ZZZZ